MPEISRFFGIVISIFYDDHNPPHFHARYGEKEAIINVSDLSVRKGNLPARVLGLVMEWAALHEKELIKDWELAKRGKPLLPIKPLD